ncbi:LPS-assembly lipoprotein LptE [Vibrio methylphosphonaticus]|uniref:LPS-assembly lipoprotein LptE n=1 Tax=Vibrio methylphosphonaticus TaxID=2946866 RepID=UPI00202AA6C1|nr:LPS assembly lipoprotein LptE [Vibrio methylphosphonaticus]MCL9773246.1 LPS assembly lipoprotein LptE [Vibrio methylphosphonaticus]
MRLLKHNLLKFFSVFLLTSLLSACGFQLRGEYTVPDDIKEISVTSFDQYSIITRKIKEQLRLSNIELVTPRMDVTNLHITGERTEDRTLSLYQNTRAAEKEITYEVEYRVTIPNLGSKDFIATMTRSYLDNPLSALAKSAERKLLENEMRELAAQQMMRQMARLKAEIEEFELEQKEAETTAEPAATPNS